jgi:PleD family two-component response regulator
VPEAILDRADSAMRHAKAQGRDRWVAFDPPLP